jgi:hypothetical protein
MGMNVKRKGHKVDNLYKKDRKVSLKMLKIMLKRQGEWF